MSHPKAPSPQTLQFYSTASYGCSYLPDHQARSLVAAPSHLINDKVYSKLVQQGFRRSGTFTYRPYCDQCQACQPLRCDALHFHPDRTQRRTLKRHGTLQARVLPLHWNADHYELYRRYQSSRHPGAGMDEDNQSQYAQFLLASHVSSRLVEFRDPVGVLKIVSVIDLLQDGLSAVYTFFDPDDAGSLGTYAILWQLEYCRQESLPWLYLGYWIEESRKMTYKTRFRPYQLLVNGRWEWPA
ncbi:arginyltransferase [Alcaligenes sp. Marseille-Q7550]